MGAATDGASGRHAELLAEHLIRDKDGQSS